MDEMVFLVPVRVGDLVHAHAQVNWAGRTSMEVGVRVVPPVAPETADDRRRFTEAEIRRRHRLAQRAAIRASRNATDEAGTR